MGLANGPFCSQTLQMVKAVTHHETPMQDQWNVLQSCLVQVGHRDPHIGQGIKSLVVHYHIHSVAEAYCPGFRPSLGKAGRPGGGGKQLGPWIP